VPVIFDYPQNDKMKTPEKFLESVAEFHSTMKTAECVADFSFINICI